MRRLVLAAALTVAGCVAQVSMRFEHAGPRYAGTKVRGARIALAGIEDARLEKERIGAMSVFDISSVRDVVTVVTEGLDVELAGAGFEVAAVDGSFRPGLDDSLMLVSLDEVFVESVSNGFTADVTGEVATTIRLHHRGRWLERKVVGRSTRTGAFVGVQEFEGALMDALDHNLEEIVRGVVEVAGKP